SGRVATGQTTVFSMGTPNNKGCPKRASGDCRVLVRTLTDNHYVTKEKVSLLDGRLLRIKAAAAMLGNRILPRVSPGRRVPLSTPAFTLDYHIHITWNPSKKRAHLVRLSGADHLLGLSSLSLFARSPHCVGKGAVHQSGSRGYLRWHVKCSRRGPSMHVDYNAGNQGVLATVTQDDRIMQETLLVFK
ncbi:hypothetical protein KJ865_11385, partial [Myxococcota bacterium]|nr:hypothetical protein [Myxococcota bacterium]